MNLATEAVNPDLDHETSLEYEIGMRLSLSSKLLLDLRSYILDVDDEIIYDLATYKNANLQETRHYGGEMDVRFEPVDYLSLFGSLGYTKTKITAGPYDGNLVPLAPKWKGNIGLEFTSELGITYRIQGNYVGERYFGNDYNNNQKKMDEYYTTCIAERISANINISISCKIWG